MGENMKSRVHAPFAGPAGIGALAILAGAMGIGCEATPAPKAPVDPWSAPTAQNAADPAAAAPAAAPTMPPGSPADASASPTPVAPDVPAAPAMNPQALADYEQGLAAYNGADLSSAASAFSAATKADPRAYKAFFALGAVYERMGNINGAMSAYQQSFGVQADFVDGIVAYALLQADTGNFGAAENLLVQKRSSFPKSAALAAALAEVKSQAKDSASAQQFAQEALKLDPTFAPAMLAVARDHYRARRLDLALYALKAVLDGFGPVNPPRDKNNAEAKLLRATIWLEQDRRVMAMEEFKAVMEGRPDLVLPRLRYATYLLESGGVADAIPILQKALQYDANNLAAHLSLGDAYRLKGEYAKARQEFDWVSQQNGGVAAVHYNLGLLFLFAPSIDGMSPREQVDAATASLTKFKELASKAEQGDVDELLKRASLKKAEIDAVAAAAAAAAAPPPTPDPAAAAPAEGAATPPPAAPPPSDAATTTGGG
jgi:Tfp pilus assembly protein PilF